MALLQWNCNGYYRHLPELRQLIPDIGASIVCLQETNFRPDHQATLRGFKLYSQERTNANRASGGVCTFVRSDVFSELVPIRTELEAVAVRIALPVVATVCNIYIPPGQALERQDLLDLVGQLPPPLLIVGDLNSSHPAWGSSRPCPRGRIVEEIVRDLDLYILNTGKPTHFSVAYGSVSHIDISLCSRALVPLFRWDVTDDLCDSDHFPIVLTLLNQQSQVTPPRWVFKRANWPLFTSRAVFDDAFTRSVDDDIQHIVDVITAAAEESIPSSSGTPRRKLVPWWTDEIAVAIRERRRAYKHYRRQSTMANLVAFKRCRAKARYLIKQSKKASWERYVSSMTVHTPSSEVWCKLRRISGIQTSSAVPGISIAGNVVTDPVSIADHLAAHFSAVSSSVNYDPEFLALKREAERAPPDFSSDGSECYNVPFTEWELRSALACCGDTSPGPDHISYQMLKHLSDDSLRHLLRVFNRIWSEGVFPSQWREGIIIPIPKPDKDPKLAGSYRPICLTNCLCKLFEKMVNRRLVWMLERRGLLSPYQCGFRASRCTTDHLVRLESAIQDAFLRGQHLIAVFFDLERAYDTTWRHGILSTLHEWKFRGNLPIFIANFMALRIFRVRVGAAYSQYYVQENGVPQGSVLSVTLFAIAIDGIVAAAGPSVTPALYVDDFSLHYSSHSMAIAQRQLQLAIVRVERWALEHGFRFATSKTSVMHFCRQRTLHPHPDLYLRGVALPVVDTYRFLGLIFDSKLTWGAHVRQLKTSCQKKLNMLRFLSGTTWGTDRTVLLRFYKALILSRLDYGSAAYGSARESVLARLNSVHHAGVRLATGAFRTSPVVSLLAEAGVPSLYLRRQQVLMSYAAKIRSMPRHPSYPCLFQNPNRQLYLARPHATRPVGIRLDGYYRNFPNASSPCLIQIPSRVPPWRVPRPEVLHDLHTGPKSATDPSVFRRIFSSVVGRYPSATRIYTDGSKVEDRVGSAFVVDGNRYLFSLPGACSIFTAELFAILEALRYAHSNGRQQFLVCTDSLSSLQALDTCFPHHPLVQRIQDLLARLLDAGTRVTFLWLPSHVGVEGNELADVAAREAGTLPPLPYSVPACDLRAQLRRAIMSHWEEEWRATPPLNKLRGIKETTKVWKSSFRTSRKEAVVLCRLRIGHGIATHVHLLRREDPPRCSCGDPLTVEHFLTECADLADLRHELKLPATLPLILRDDGTSADLVIRFMRECGLYSRF